MSNTQLTITREALVFVANRAGATVLPDNAQWTNRMEIRSETSSRLYIVAQHKTNKEWACGCMGFKRYRHCKHLNTMLPLLVSGPGTRGNLK